jgi:hypothetical protein
MSRMGRRLAYLAAATIDLLRDGSPNRDGGDICVPLTETAALS